MTTFSNIPELSTLNEILAPVVNEPWQRAPAELIAHGIQHFNQNREEFDQRLAFLLFDVGIEIAMKTFLLLHGEISGATTTRNARKEAAYSESFPIKAQAVRDAIPDKFSEGDLKSSLHYHSIRNKLYHDGSGINVSSKDLAGYAEFALRTLDNLLNVNLGLLFRSPQEAQLEKEHLAQEAHFVEATIAAKKSEINQCHEEVEGIVREIVALFAPRLLNARYWKEFYEESSKNHYSLPDSFFAPLTGTGYETESVPKPSSGSQLTFDRFINRFIVDSKVREYILAFPEKERRNFQYALCNIMDEDGTLDVDQEDLDALYLCCLLLNSWPDFPFDLDSEGYAYQCALAYPNDPAISGTDFNGEVLDFSTDDILAHGDRLLTELRGLNWSLREWLDEWESEESGS